METNELTPRILKMTTKTGFVELFWEAVNADQQQHTHEEIYDILEKEYQQVFKRRRYTSFKSSRRRRDQ